MDDKQDSETTTRQPHGEVPAIGFATDPEFAESYERYTQAFQQVGDPDPEEPIPPFVELYRQDGTAILRIHYDLTIEVRHGYLEHFGLKLGALTPTVKLLRDEDDS